MSPAVSEALAEELRRETGAERVKRVMEGLDFAFSGFSDEEIMVLNGIIMEPISDTDAD